MLKQIIASRIVNIILVVSLSTQSVLSAIPVNAESDYNSLNLSNVSQESNSQETGGFFDFIFSFFKINNNNTVKEYNPNDLVNNQDLFGYMPGEIIVKFKHSNDLHNAEHAIKYQMDLEFDATNIDTEAVIPVLEEKKQGLHMNSYEDYVSVQKAELVGLDRMYNIDIPGLQRKSELFIERFKMELSKLPVEQAHEGVEQRIVSVPTQEFGMVSINISNQEYIIDPFTLQLLDELRERSDVEYADVNARVYINNDLVIEPAIQEPQDLQEDVIEIEIPVETPDKSDSNNEEQIIIEIPDIIEEVEDIEEVVEEIENTEENLENEDKSIFKSIIDLIVAPIQEVIEIIEPDVSEEIEDPIDALFEEQWALHNIGQSYHTGPDNTSTGSADVDINFLETYKEVDYNKGEGVVVAVIDTGISYTNEEIDEIFGLTNQKFQLLYLVRLTITQMEKLQVEKYLLILN